MKLNNILVGSLLIFVATICNAGSEQNSQGKIKWVLPLENSCKQYSGEVIKENCNASWQNAQEICKVNGASLPTLVEVEKAIAECGGKITDSAISKEAKANIKNKKYQQCMKDKGFTKFGWTSTTNKHNTDYALYANFSVGGIFNYNKANKQTFICIKK